MGRNKRRSRETSPTPKALGARALTVSTVQSTDLGGQLGEFLLAEGRDPVTFPNAIASMWLYMTEKESERERVLIEVLAPALNRLVTQLRERLPIGSPKDCAEKLAAYQRVGAQRIYLWPINDEVQQIEIFREQVIPQII